MSQLIRLDVCELEPPEPMAKILNQLQQLPLNTALRVQHRRQPFPLYSLLAEMGFAHQCLELGYCDFAIYIWPDSDQQLQAYCEQAIEQEQQL